MNGAFAEIIDFKTFNVFKKNIESENMNEWLGYSHTEKYLNYYQTC